MRKKVSAILVLLILAAGSAAAQDPVIEKLLERISLDRMYSDVDTLVAFGTRRSDQPEGFLAQDWIYDEFSAMGFSPHPTSSDCERLSQPRFL